MPQSLCPLCGSPCCVRADTRSGPVAVRYECPSQCGSFRIGRAFLHYVWPTVQTKDKRALTAYLHATKGPRRAAPLIEGDNYRTYVSLGRTLQKGATAAPRVRTKRGEEKTA